MIFPDKLNKIPTSYFEPCPTHRGKLIAIHYTTYEAFTYPEKKQALQKRAIVYLPYNYSSGQSYNVFYIMHGGWRDETIYLGSPEKPHRFKNVLDNAIANHQIKPMIIVCPTYNNTSKKDSGNYDLALKLTDLYHQELINDLIPAVEGKLSTFVNNTSKEELQRTRNHRAFCGFSMGSVATWRVFEHCLAYFRYFFPSSGAITNNGTLMANYVKRQGFGPKDFYIYATTGTKDFAFKGFDEQLKNMLYNGQNIFNQAYDENKGNTAYLVVPNAVHGVNSAIADFYNVLVKMWQR